MITPPDQTWLNKIQQLIIRYFNIHNSQKEDFFTQKLAPLLRTALQEIGSKDYRKLFELVGEYLKRESEAAHDLQQYLEEAGLVDLINLNVNLVEAENHNPESTQEQTPPLESSKAMPAYLKKYSEAGQPYRNIFK